MAKIEKKSPIEACFWVWKLCPKVARASKMGPTTALATLRPTSLPRPPPRREVVGVAVAGSVGVATTGRVGLCCRRSRREDPIAATAGSTLGRGARWGADPPLRAFDTGGYHPVLRLEGMWTRRPPDATNWPRMLWLRTRSHRSAWNIRGSALVPLEFWEFWAPNLCRPACK
jgi:hypothetical protein